MKIIVIDHKTLLKKHRAGLGQIAPNFICDSLLADDALITTLHLHFPLSPNVYSHVPIRKPP